MIQDTNPDPDPLIMGAYKLNNKDMGNNDKNCKRDFKISKN